MPRRSPATPISTLALCIALVMCGTAQKSASAQVHRSVEPADYDPERVIELGLELFSPIYLTSDPLSLGLGGRVRAAWRLPMGLRPELQLGYSVQPVTDQEESLRLTQMGLGARFGLPRLGRLHPVVGGGVALNYWNRSLIPGEAPAPPAIPSPFAPADPDETVWAPGLYALAGLAVELAPWLYLDVGLRLDLAFSRNIFVRDSRRAFETNQLYLSPSVGVAFLY